jgi:hypothetical protein
MIRQKCLVWLEQKYLGFSVKFFCTTYLSKRQTHDCRKIWQQRSVQSALIFVSGSSSVAMTYPECSGPRFSGIDWTPTFHIFLTHWNMIRGSFYIHKSCLKLAPVYCTVCTYRGYATGLFSYVTIGRIIKTSEASYFRRSISKHPGSPVTSHVTYVGIPWSWSIHYLYHISIYHASSLLRAFLLVLPTVLLILPLQIFNLSLLFSELCLYFQNAFPLCFLKLMIFLMFGDHVWRTEEGTVSKLMKCCTAISFIPAACNWWRYGVWRL